MACSYHGLAEEVEFSPLPSDKFLSLSNQEEEVIFAKNAIDRGVYISHEANRRNQSRVFHKKALAIREMKLGEDHPLVAESYIYIAKTFCSSTEKAEKIELLEKALAIQIAKLGTDHPDVGDTYFLIASEKSRMYKCCDCFP